jgi:hypothetical protein
MLEERRHAAACECAWVVSTTACWRLEYLTSVVRASANFCSCAGMDETACLDSEGLWHSFHASGQHALEQAGASIAARSPFAVAMAGKRVGEAVQQLHGAVHGTCGLPFSFEPGSSSCSGCQAFSRASPCKSLRPNARNLSTQTQTWLLFAARRA